MEEARMRGVVDTLRKKARGGELEVEDLLQ
jgi:hypothetical protein